MNRITRSAFYLSIVLALFTAGCGKVKMPTFGKKNEEPVVATPVPAKTEVAPQDGKKDAVAEAAKSTTAPAETPPVVDKNAEVIVLCYHRLEGKAGGAYSIEPELFREHMQTLKDQGLGVISMKQFLAWRRGEGTIPPKSVLITIDDGYDSGYKVALPILKEFGYPATYFIYTNYVEGGVKAITWAQLEELRDAGMEIASHTISHMSLTGKSHAKGNYEAWMKNEIEGSKRLLEDKLGIRVTSIAYPGGRHNDEVDAVCKAAGYEAGFSTYGQRLGISAAPYGLGRYDVTYKYPHTGKYAFEVAIAFEGMKAPTGESVLAQDAAVSMITEPANGATINNAVPLLKANLSTMGQLDQGTVVMRVSGVGKVPAKFDPETGIVSYTISKEQKLRPGPVSVIIGAKSKGRKVETRWAFHYDPSAEPASPADAALPPRKAAR